MVWLSLILGVIKEGFHWAGIVAQARLEQDEALRKTKGEVLDAAKTAIKSGDTSALIGLADRLRQPGA